MITTKATFSIFLHFPGICITGFRNFWNIHTGEQHLCHQKKYTFVPCKPHRIIFLKMNKPALLLSLIVFMFFTTNLIHAQEKTSGQGQRTSDKHQLGDACGGGKIFWLDSSGQHGLISASADQSSKGVAWNPGKLIATGSDADELFAGLKNSEKIVSKQGNSALSAAKICLDYSVTSNNVEYSDWYLPSKFELNLLYQQKMLIGGFNLTSGIYWSSTESSASPDGMAWEQEFKFGSQHEDDKDLPDQVRCIRKF